MPRQWECVAVVEMHAEGLGVELVDEALAGLDQARPRSRYAIHLERVDAMKVDRMRMVAGIAKVDPNPVPFRAAQSRSWNAAIVGPGREFDARYDLDGLVHRRNAIFAQCLPVLQRGHLAVIKVG